MVSKLSTITTYFKLKRLSFFRYFSLIVIFSQFWIAISFFGSVHSLSVLNFASESGNADFFISKTQNVQDYDYHFSESLVENLNNKKLSTHFVPRLYSLAKISQYGSQSSLNTSQILLCGFNNTLEQSVQASFKQNILFGNAKNSIGSLKKCDIDYEPNEDSFIESIPFGYCIISRSYAKQNNLTVDDKINLELVEGLFVLTILEIVENYGRLPNLGMDYVLTDLFWTQYVLKLPHQINNILGFFDLPEKFYLSNFDRSKSNIQDVSDQIHQILGDKFHIISPRLLMLEYTQIFSFNLQILSNLTYILLIALYCIFNKLWMDNYLKKNEVFKNVQENSTNFYPKMKIEFKKILQDTLFGFFSEALLVFLIIGAVLGVLINLYISFWNILILVGVIFLIHIFLTLYLIIQVNFYNFERKLSFKMAEMLSVIIGMSLILFSYYIFQIPTEIIQNLNLSFLAQYLSIVLLCLLVGAIFLGISGFKLIQTFKLFFRNKIQSFKSFQFKKHTTRNIQIKSSNFGLLFVITLLFFNISYNQIKNQGLILSYSNAAGSDLVIFNTGSQSEGTSLNSSFLNQLQIESIVEAAAPVCTNFEETFSSDAIDNLQSFLPDFSVNSEDFDSSFKITASVSDKGLFNTESCGVVGINQSYIKVIDKSLIQWDKSSGSSFKSMNSMLLSLNSCILSKSLADLLLISQINQTIFLHTSNEKGNASITSQFLVVGIVERLPGFSIFKRTNLVSSSKPGILLNLERYMDLSGINRQNVSTYQFDKIMVKLNNDFSNSPENIENSSVLEFKAKLNQDYGMEFSFSMIDSLSQIQQLTFLDNQLNYIYNSFLVSSIFISCALFFGSTYLFRQKKTKTKQKFIPKKKRGQFSWQNAISPKKVITSTILVVLSEFLGVIIAIWTNHIISSIFLLPEISKISRISLLWIPMLFIIACHIKARGASE